MKEEVINLHQDVIDRCLAGSRDAQYELYKLYSKAMFNVCLRMVNGRDQAEDILQEAFISAFGNLKSYRGDATFGSWLKRIVINKCINHLKKESTIMVPLDDERFDMPEEEEARLDPGELQLSVDKIKQGMEDLPDGFRSVLSLYLFEGYDHKEIAEILGITESTSKSQFLRAKAKLRTILKSKVNYG